MRRKALFIVALLIVATAIWSLISCGGKTVETTPPTVAVACDCGQEIWSDTNPKINMSHVFCGEINKRGKAVGFHSRPGGKDPATARITKMLDDPNSVGIYTAKVQICDKDKGGFSSFYPDTLSVDDVLNCILHAYKNGTVGKNGKFSGPSGKGFTIQGWLLSDGSGNINTAYPIYKKD